MSSVFGGEGLLDVSLGGVKSVILESIVDETSVDLGECSDFPFLGSWILMTKMMLTRNLTFVVSEVFSCVGGGIHSQKYLLGHP